MPPPDNIGLKFFRAFTLAETLITLAIIGVVAALTMPSLIQHHKKQEASARLKKFYSTMEQAIRLSEIDNGSATDWYREGNIKNEDGESDYEKNSVASKEFFLKYLGPYFKYTKISDVKFGENEINSRVYLSDTSYFQLWNGGCLDIRFDTNGDRGPNTFGKDRFMLLLCQKEIERINRCGSKQKVFCAYGEPNLTNDKSREKSLEFCKTNPLSCSNLLQMDGWEFKDDYPYRL